MAKESKSAATPAPAVRDTGKAPGEILAVEMLQDVPVARGLHRKGAVVLVQGSSGGPGDISQDCARAWCREKGGTPLARVAARVGEPLPERVQRALEGEAPREFPPESEQAADSKNDETGGN